MLNLINQTSYEVPLARLEKLVTHAYQRLNVDPSRMLSVVLVDKATIQAYNLTYKNVDRPTDVLTFPSDEEDELGDVIIALDVAKNQALAYGHSYEREVAFLLIHGLLHTLGFTHDTQDDEDVMIQWQNTLLSEQNFTR